MQCQPYHEALLKKSFLCCNADLFVQYQYVQKALKSFIFFLTFDTSFLHVKTQNKKATSRSFPLRQAQLWCKCIRTGSRERTMNLTDMHDQVHVMVNACRLTDLNLRINQKMTVVPLLSFSVAMLVVKVSLSLLYFLRSFLINWIKKTDVLSCLVEYVTFFSFLCLI